MKLYSFNAEDDCSIIYCASAERIVELKLMGYCETPQEAKEKHVKLLNDRIESLTRCYKNEIADLSTKINIVKNF